MDYYELSIETDRRRLENLGLQMPHPTKKYKEAVLLHALIEETSPFFVHIQAARAGVERIYKALNQTGLIWNDERQSWDEE